MLHTAGAALQSLVVGGLDLVVGYPPGPQRAGFRGALLLPWPNRLRDGCYEFDGVEYQAPLNEVPRRNALHGLLAWTEFSVLERTQGTAQLHATVPAQPAYPSRLEVEVLLELLDDGLRTTVRALNVGDRAAPYGVSTHPYLRCSTGMVDDWTLQVAADEVVEVDERMLPTGRLLDARQIGLDFRQPTSLRDVQLDHCFRRAGDSQNAWAELRASNGVGVRITAPGTWAQWWQVFTSDTTPGTLRRAAVALEPMTCPPDAFNTDEAFVLGPGAHHEVSWTITAV